MAVTRIAILLFVRRERGNVSTSRPESLFFFSPFLRTPCLFFSSSSFSCPCFFATDVCTYDVYRSILDIISLYLTPTFPPRACGGPIFFGRPAKITVYKRVRNSGVGEGGRKEGREGYLPFLTDVGESFETLCRPTRLHFSPWPIHRERERYIGLVVSCSSVGVYREG